MTARLSPGSTAPAFSLPNSDGDQVSLTDFPDSTVILYFYPAAMTPGCTTQAVNFTAALPELTGAGYYVLGVSPDPVERLAKFKTSSSVVFPLLCDEDKTVLNEYAAYGTKKMYGKEIIGVIRSTFVIDVDSAGVGTIRVAQYNVKATGHVAKLRRELGI